MTAPEGNKAGGGQATKAAVPQFLPAMAPPNMLKEVRKGIAAEGKEKEDVKRDLTQEVQKRATRVGREMSTENSGHARGRRNQGIARTPKIKTKTMAT
jgi:hypothetical protein